MIASIDGHRADLGVEPISRVLPIAPSTYHAHAARRADPARLPARTKRDAELKGDIQQVSQDNLEVYGARKFWRQLRREGQDVARCTVERLMKNLGIQGVVRGKPARTTMSTVIGGGGGGPLRLSRSHMLSERTLPPFFDLASAGVQRLSRRDKLDTYYDRTQTIAVF